MSCAEMDENRGCKAAFVVCNTPGSLPVSVTGVQVTKTGVIVDFIRGRRLFRRQFGSVFPVCVMNMAMCHAALKFAGCPATRYRKDFMIGKWHCLPSCRFGPKTKRTILYR